MNLKNFLPALFLIIGSQAIAQVETEEKVFQINEPDSFAVGNVVLVEKDSRITVLEKKLAEYNAAVVYKNTRTAKGYRLMLLSTSDRNMAITLRSKLLQSFPDQNVYMSFQSPFIKLKFGNFLDKAEAVKYQKQILAMGLVNGNIYVLPETIEVRPEKQEK